MDEHDYGAVKIIHFSDNITNEELIKTGELLAKWAADNTDYGIISFMPPHAETVTDISSIRKALSAIRNSKLRIYGIQNSSVSGFVAKVVGQLLGLKLNQFPDVATMIQKMKNDNPEFKVVIEEYNLEEQIESFA